MGYETIALRKGDKLGWLTVQRPEALNALNAKVLDEFPKALDELAADPEVGVIAITGAGDKGFVAGADIAEIAPLRGLGGREFARRGQALLDRVEFCPKPVIAAINGYALGGGCELAIACHLRVASEKAAIGLPEVTLGVIPGYGGTQRLPRLIGRGPALDMILTGRMVKADEALRLGLVDRVVPHEELAKAVGELAATINSRGPLAVRAALESVRGGLQSSQAEGLRLEAQLFGLLCGTADMIEGTAAFLGKRKAAFKGE